MNDLPYLVIPCGFGGADEAVLDYMRDRLGIDGLQHCLPDSRNDNFCYKISLLFEKLLREGEVVTITATGGSAQVELRKP